MSVPLKIASEQDSSLSLNGSSFEIQGIQLHFQYPLLLSPQEPWAAS